jgi:hypothetical protein
MTQEVVYQREVTSAASLIKAGPRCAGGFRESLTQRELRVALQLVVRSGDAGEIHNRELFKKLGRSQGIW